MSVKRTLARMATGSWALPAVRRLCLGGSATVFTLHRFGHQDGDPDGLPAAALDEALQRFRAAGFTFVGLGQLVCCAREGRTLPRNAIAFTVDDGYFDFAEVAMPVFARNHCPVTMFLVTGFIDGKQWMWWDKVTYLFDHTKCSTLAFEGFEATMDLTDMVARKEASGRFSTMLKGLSTDKKLEYIDRLAELLAVDLPHEPPSQYRPMSWDQIRTCAAQGASFGPHTVSHPILSRSSEREARREITDSWQRVQTEVASAIPVFAYPNGGVDDFGEREIGIMRESGLLAAVTTRPGHLPSPITESRLFELPRWDLTADPVRMSQVTSGLEAAKAIVRQKLGMGV